MGRAQLIPLASDPQLICGVVPDRSIVYCMRDNDTVSGSSGTRVGGWHLGGWHGKQNGSKIRWCEGPGFRIAIFFSAVIVTFSPKSHYHISFFVLNEELSILTEKIEADTHNKLSLFYPTAASYPLSSSLLSSPKKESSLLVRTSAIYAPHPKLACWNAIPNMRVFGSWSVQKDGVLVK